MHLVKIHQVALATLALCWFQISSDDDKKHGHWRTTIPFPREQLGLYWPMDSGAIQASLLQHMPLLGIQ